MNAFVFNRLRKLIWAACAGIGGNMCRSGTDEPTLFSSEQPDSA